MPNRNYNSGNVPSFGAALDSATVRNEFAAVSTGFTGVETELDSKATVSGTETLTNKTFNLANNTLTGTLAQFNAALSDSDFATSSGTDTLTNKTINLASNTLTGTTAQFNTALSDGDFATLAGTESLTNKTLTSPTLSNPTVSGVQVYPAGSNTAPPITTTGDTNTGVFFPAADTVAVATGGTERVRINSYGVGAGLTPTSRNNTSLHTVDGLGFPATQVPSTDVNTLDDYEEGTWTPTLSGFSFTGVQNLFGNYVKIGKVVEFSIYMYSSTGTVSSTAGANASLPFTAGARAAGTMTTGNTNDADSYHTQITSNLVYCSPASSAVVSLIISGTYIAS